MVNKDSHTNIQSDQKLFMHDKPVNKNVCKSIYIEFIREWQHPSAELTL